jgi:hypothetical protein
MPAGKIIINCFCTVEAEAVSLVLDGEFLSLNRSGRIWMKDFLIDS